MFTNSDKGKNKTKRNSIDVYTSVGYMLRIDCWEAEKDLKTTPGSDCALNALAIDEPLNMQDYILMEIYRCGLMQKIHLNFNISC